MALSAVTPTSGGRSKNRNTSGATSAISIISDWLAHALGRKNSRCTSVSPGPSGPSFKNSIWMPPRAQRARCTKKAARLSGASP